MSNTFLIVDINGKKNVRIDPNTIESYSPCVREGSYINSEPNSTKLVCSSGTFIINCTVERLDAALKELHFMIKEVG